MQRAGSQSVRIGGYEERGLNVSLGTVEMEVPDQSPHEEEQIPSFMYKTVKVPPCVARPVQAAAIRKSDYLLEVLGFPHWHAPIHIGKVAYKPLAA